MTTAQVGEFDDESKAHDLATGQTHQLTAGFGGATGGQQIIDDQDPGGILKAIGVDFQTIAAIFQLVVHPMYLARQFAGFAHGYEPQAQGRGQAGAHDESPRFNPHD